MKICTYCSERVYGATNHIECELNWWQNTACENAAELGRYQRRCAELETRLDAIRKAAK